MPNNRPGQGQGQPQGQGQGHNPNGGGAQGARDQVRDAAHQVQEGAEQAGDRLKQQAQQAGDRLKQGYGDVKDQALSGYRQAEEAIAGNPMQSILIGFGVGFGIGLVVTAMLGAKEKTWAEKYLPESLQDAPDKYKSLVGQLKTLPKSVLDNLPPSIAKYVS